VSVAVGSLPRDMRDDSVDEEIVRLSHSEDGSEAAAFNGKAVAPSAMAKRGRIERGEVARPHVIGSVRFGPDRLTTCATCAFTATGRSNHEMALAWNEHPVAVRRAFAESRHPASRM
jgi:hypothetical protein